MKSSSSNMSYNLWLKNKKYKLNRRPVLGDLDTPILRFDTGDFADYYPNNSNNVEPAGRITGVGSSFDKNMSDLSLDPHRLTSRVNNVYYVTSPHSFQRENPQGITWPVHNDNIPATLRGNAYPIANQLYPSMYQLSHDYPHHFFPHELNKDPLIMHIYSHNDPYENSQYPKLTPGEIFPVHPTNPVNINHLKDFIIRNLAIKAAKLISSSPKHFSPAGDYYEEHAEHFPQLNSEEIRLSDDPKIHAIASTLYKLHHRFENEISDEDKRNMDLSNYINHEINNEYDPHMKKFLALLHNALTREFKPS